MVSFVPVEGLLPFVIIEPFVQSVREVWLKANWALIEDETNESLTLQVE